MSFLLKRLRCESGLFFMATLHWQDKRQRRVTLGCIHLQGKCLDVADVAMGTGTLWADTLKASARVDTSCPAAAVVLLAQTLVHIWKTKQRRYVRMRRGKRDVPD